MRLTIDFETVDYGLQNKIGSGWPWGAVNTLGLGVKIDDEPTYYETDLSKVRELAQSASVIVAHNAIYEAGILNMMGLDTKNIKFRCTLLGAKLLCNILPDFSLDSLAKRFFKERKTSHQLLLAGGEIGLYEIPKTYEDPEFYTGGKPNILKRLKTQRKKMMNLVWANLDKIQAASPIVGDYCIQDVDLTAKLDDMLVEKLGLEQYEYYCQLINVAVAMRAKGIRVNISKTYDVMFQLHHALRPLERQLWDKFGHFNYNSPKQVKEWAHDQLGLKGIETQEEDDFGQVITVKESFGKEWIEANKDNEDVQLFAKVKKIDKLSSFCNSIIEHEKHGRIYPQLNIMQARTGRFSCTSPNVQQIPSRDEEFAPLLRGLFLPEVGENWYSLDFSSQEPRLQVHYAEAIGSENGKELANMYRQNAKTDLYTEACKMVKDNSGVDISRNEAKIMTLALSYGMGKDKGAKALGVSVKEYEKVRNAYFKGASYLKELNQYCQDRMIDKGFVKTIGGRKTFNVGGKEYKALNSLIQGSAFDECAVSLINAFYKHNIIPLCTVHDEINISSSGRKEAELLQFEMENCLPLRIPRVAEIGVGDNWSEAK